MPVYSTSFRRRGLLSAAAILASVLAAGAGAASAWSASHAAAGVGAGSVGGSAARAAGPVELAGSFAAKHPTANRPARGRKRHAIRVGSVLIPPCPASRLAWCTKLQVPYDYFDQAAGTIGIGFQWYPATGRKATGTVLAVQGGPGYATTDYASQYRGMLGPLLATRNLLLINLRGTGDSSAFTCAALQNWILADGTAAYVADTGACGRQLNHTRKLPHGGYVQASDLYTTANAARDVALILHRLGQKKVDLYGDSYGTYFAQVFTARYPRLLRSVTLDSAYPVDQTDPFYPHTIETARTAFTLACERSIACRRAAPGSSWHRIAVLAGYLRQHPVHGKTMDPYGDVLTQKVGVNELIQLVNIAGYDNGVYRELDPAARALLQHHDAAPLLRLAAQEIYTGSSGAASSFNDGLYQASTCLDYPQPFSYSAPEAQRLAQYDKAVAALPANLFAPFTVHEWVTEPAEEFDACLDWPAPQRPDPPIPPGHKGPLAPRSLPVMVLSGDLDSLTTPFEGHKTAVEMGPSARWIEVDNDTHITAYDDTFGCAQGLVRQFIAQPSRLRRLNASCTKRTPEVRVVGAFPRDLAGVAPATPVSGDRAHATGLKLAADGAAVVGDAVWHWYYGDGVHGFGLRGGSCVFSGPATAIVIKFRKVRWTLDTAVSGRALWNQVTGHVRAWLTVTALDGRVAVIYLSYHDYVHHPDASISGSYHGLRIAAVMPAP